MRYKVIQCYTGGVGSRILRQLLEHPQFEVVGVLVSGEHKHGRDIGELVGLPSVGIRATMDFEEILALPADAACWNGFISSVPGSPTAEVDASVAGPDPILRLLRSGKNVYSGPGPWYFSDGPVKDAIDAACGQGGVSFCAAGNIPGLISDAFPLFVSGYSGKVSRVWCRQTDHLADHPSAHELKHHVGLGLPLDVTPPGAELIDELYRWPLEQSARQVAAALNIKLDDFRLISKDVAAAREDVVIGDGFRIEQGTVAGLRWTYGGFVGGYQWYTIICELTAAMGLGEGWRQNELEPNWTVRIDGTPSLEATMGTAGPRDRVGPVLDLNAARAVTMLPLLCEAPVGFRSILDLPFVTCHAGVRPGD